MSNTAEQSTRASKKPLSTQVCTPHQGTSSPRKKAGAPLGVVPKNKQPSERPELVGQQFGNVKVFSPTVVWLGPKNRRIQHVFVECVKCFSRACVSLDNLRKARTGGCLPCGRPPQTYPDWLYQRVQAMKHRCCNPNNSNYANYGGRGIRFNFAGVKEGTLWIVKNLGLPPQDPYLQLDRIDPDGHYEPGNLRWADVRVNQLNKRGRQGTARMHAFRLEFPHVTYADTTIIGLVNQGLSYAEIAARWAKPSQKPKGVYGTSSTPDLAIASLVRGY